MKLHPGYEWHIFHILTSEDIADVIPYFSPRDKDTFGDNLRLAFFIFETLISM